MDKIARGRPDWEAARSVTVRDVRSFFDRLPGRRISLSRFTIARPAGPLGSPAFAGLGPWSRATIPASQRDGGTALLTRQHRFQLAASGWPPQRPGRRPTSPRRRSDGITEGPLNGARRWAAAGLLWLAGAILRGVIRLYRRRAMSRAQVRHALSMTRILERSAWVLLFGNRRCRSQRTIKMGCGQ